VSEIVEGPGETLRAARQAMEISCREVAEALNLPIRTVEAIEANDYEQLPGAVFTRGYIRAYAKLLELDSDPVVARYPEFDNVTENLDVIRSRRPQDLVREYPLWVLGGAVGLLVLVLVSLAVWLWPASDESAPADESMQIPAESPFESGPQALAEAQTTLAARVAPQSVSQPSPPAAALKEQSEESVAETITAVELGAAVKVPDNAPAGVQRISATGDDRLWFEFSDDCWVAIKSASGASLYSDLGHTGATLELVGAAPFRVLLGYAPGVAMSFNDDVVALGPHTRNNVANLVLGQ
jgi:cytoskeleton protein RodZ